MIKEYRLGNFVFDVINKKNIELSLDDFKCMNNFARSNHKTPYNPILLTIEWLNNFGFENYTHYDNCFVKKTKNDFEFILDNTFVLMDIDLTVEVKYVHQLQNLYFCITAEELSVVANGS